MRVSVCTCMCVSVRVDTLAQGSSGQTMTQNLQNRKSFRFRVGPALPPVPKLECTRNTASATQGDSVGLQLCGPPSSAAVPSDFLSIKGLEWKIREILNIFWLIYSVAFHFTFVIRVSFLFWLSFSCFQLDIYSSLFIWFLLQTTCLHICSYDFWLSHWS